MGLWFKGVYLELASEKEEVLPLQSPHLNAFSALIPRVECSADEDLKSNQIVGKKITQTLIICSILLFLKSSNFRLTDLVKDHKVGQFYKINSGLKLRLIWRTKTGQMDQSSLSPHSMCF